VTQSRDIPATQRIAWILWIIAIAVPLNTPATVFAAVLQMRLRFDAASRIGIASSVVRNVSIVILALAGAGPLSFVIPLVLVAMVEGAMGYLAVREAVWKRRPDLRTWPELFAASRWLILTVIANAPNPAGAGILQGSKVFEAEGISPIGLLLGAAGPTVIAIICFWFI
jgi:O-antigen/teichoic acid export membrane protein